jgi:serine/threonine protein kinase
VKDATYRDLTRLGSGTYGDVYSAYERATGRKVALKETKVGADGESYGFPQNAMREITILKQLDHPNIVALLSVVVALPTATAPESDASDGSNGEGEADGQSATIANAGDADAPSTDALASSIGDTALRGAVFLVFPFCECDLEGYMATAALGKHHVRSFAFQLLAALSHIHARKIAHRDIKGANILVTARNVVKLADWGLARRMNALAPAGGAPPPYDLNIVTLPYRAPEVLLGKRDYDCAVDNWSMGALLAEFLVRPAKVVGGPIQNRPGPIFASGGTESTQVSLFCTVTFRANPSHNLTRSPSHIFSDVTCSSTRSGPSAALRRKSRGPGTANSSSGASSSRTI